jgi:aminopeptidase N
MAPLDVNAQTAALLPAFVGDMAQAEAWDRYSLDLTLDPVALTVSGSMRLDLRNRSADSFDALFFHLYPNHPDFGGSLRVTNVLVNGQPALVSSEAGNVRMQVSLAQPLAPGEETSVTLDFVASTQRNASSRAYGAFNQEAGVWALASFYPVLARYFPGSGWDRRPISSRGDLAVTETTLYDVTVLSPPPWVLATTGSRIEDGAAENGQRRERFVSGPQRDFFITALNGLDQASAVVDGTRVVTYFQPASAAAGQRSLQAAEDALRAFNARFGPYPLAEMEVVQAALTNFLGVEYPGIMLIEQNLYRQGGLGLEVTVAHEVAHQWWYSLVGNDVQGQPWLDEGLASFSQIVYREARGDGGGAEELWAFRERVEAARAAGRDGVVDQPAGAFSGNYVTLVYAKGALFFQALRQQLGDETFFRFLQNYYATYRYRDATGEGLLATAESTCGCDLKQFYADWITTVAPVTLP